MRNITFSAEERRAMATISELQTSLRTGGRRFTRDEMSER